MKLKAVTNLTNKCSRNFDSIRKNLVSLKTIKFANTKSAIAIVVALAMLFHFSSLSGLKYQVEQLESLVASKDAELQKSKSANSELLHDLNKTTLDLEDMTDERDSLLAERKELEDQLEMSESMRQQYDVLCVDMNESEQFLIDYIEDGGEVEDLGIWKCTAYCTERYPHICGCGKGKTSSGSDVKPNSTIAVNRANLGWLPYGTIVYIEGIGVRTVEDTGGGVANKQFDCAVSSHQGALSWSGQGNRRAWRLT